MLAYKSQVFFLLIGILSLGGVVKFVQEFNSVRQWMKDNHEAPVYGWAEFSDFKITLMTACVSIIVNQVMNMLTWNIFYGLCKEKNDEELRKSKTLKACNSLYKGIYFIVVTLWGYQTLKDQDYLPTSLFGKGDYQHFNVNYPRQNWPEGMRTYYLGTMGYHVH